MPEPLGYIHILKYRATEVCVPLNGLFLLIKQMKAAFTPYVIFLPPSPVGREGSESWNKAVGTHWEEEEEAPTWKNASGVPN